MGVDSKNHLFPTIRPLVTTYSFIICALVIMSGLGIGLYFSSILAMGYKVYRKEPEASTVSAPGKALIAGGYLVLEEPNVGVVVSCTSRFFTTIKACGQEELEEDREGGAGQEDKKMESPMDGLVENELLIVVFSPQFYTRFCFVLNVKSNELRQVEGNENEFVQTCLQMVMNFARKQRGSLPFEKTMKKLIEKGQFLGIKLRADNDFYSQAKLLQERGMPLTSESLSTLPSFIECPINTETGKLEVAKTGMGSSAALTTSLVGALLKYLKIAHLGGQRDGLLGLIELALFSFSFILRGEGHDTSSSSTEEEKRIVHNLAQVAHSVAQGKIGSGFDVAAAVYGTQTYSRFPPSILDDVLERPTADSIYNVVMDRSSWTQRIQSLNLPNGFDIIMGDVCGGSESTSMAKKVIKWRKSGVEAEKLWNSLRDINTRIFEKLRVLTSLELNFSEAFNVVMSTTSVLCGEEWMSELNDATNGSSSKYEGTEKILKVLIEIRQLFKQARAHLKKMGEEAGVEIEPPSQTKLVDATEKVPGVLCAGVPGAGGEDAVFAVTLCSSTRTAVETMWSQWHTTGAGKSTGMIVCPLLLHAETNKRISGIKSENLGWATATAMTSSSSPGTPITTPVTTPQKA